MCLINCKVKCSFRNSDYHKVWIIYLRKKLLNDLFKIFFKLSLPNYCQTTLPVRHICSVNNEWYLDGFVPGAWGKEGSLVSTFLVITTRCLVDSWVSHFGGPRHALHHMLMASQLHLPHIIALFPEGYLKQIFKIFMANGLYIFECVFNYFISKHNSFWSINFRFTKKTSSDTSWLGLVYTNEHSRGKLKLVLHLPLHSWLIVVMAYSIS